MKPPQICPDFRLISSDLDLIADRSDFRSGNKFIFKCFDFELLTWFATN